MTEKQQKYLYSIHMEFGIVKDDSHPKFVNTQKYTSILTAWSENAQCQQTSAGLNHFRRDVIIADFDASQEEFDKVFMNSGLPKFTYILKNKETGHLQAGYVLKTPFVWTPYNEREKEIYLKCKRNLNSLCPNNGYKGWRCKNPYYNEFETTWNNIIYDKNYITEILYKINSNNNICKKNILKIDNKTEKRNSGIQYERTAGRNNFYLYNTIIYYSNCKTNNIIMSEEELFNWLEENEKTLRSELYNLNPNIQNKDLPKKELLSICHNAKNYVDKNYNKDKAGGYSKSQRENSLELRQLNKERNFIDFCDYMDGGVEFKEILELVGIKKTVGYEYRQLYNELIENGTYYYFRESNGYGVNQFNMIHDNQLQYPYYTFPNFQ